MDQTKEKAQTKVKVKLLGEHTHAGNPCNAGDVLDLRPDQAERLVKAARAEVAR